MWFGLRDSFSDYVGHWLIVVSIEMRTSKALCIRKRTGFKKHFKIHMA